MGVPKDIMYLDFISPLELSYLNKVWRLREEKKSASDVIMVAGASWTHLCTLNEQSSRIRGDNHSFWSLPRCQTSVRDAVGFGMEVWMKGKQMGVVHLDAMVLLNHPVPSKSDLRVGLQRTDLFLLCSLMCWSNF